MNQDRNFDDIAHKFAKNIYGSEKGDIRQTIVWQDLQQALSVQQTSAVTGGQSWNDNEAKSLAILDVGGGLGQMSQKLAVDGHRITLCDISQQMLELAQQQVEQAGLSEQFRYLHCPLQQLASAEIAQTDVVLFHAVMEWLHDPQAALELLLSQMKAGAIVSVMFYNHHGLVLKNVTCGNIPHVLAGMPHRKRFKLQPQKGLLPHDVYQWIEDQSFQIGGKSGIRCFHDYIGNQQYMGDYTAEQVLQLEQQLCRTEPYLSLGRYIHVWAQKNIGC